MEWLWNEPVNGVEIVISVVAGVVTTFLSVVVGVVVALRSERRQAFRDEARAAEAARWEQFAVDTKAGRSFVQRSVLHGQSPLVPLWFRDPEYHESEEPRGHLFARYDEEALRAWGPRIAENMPDSQRALGDWVDRRIQDFIEGPATDFPSAHNEVVRHASMKLDDQITTELKRYVDGSRTIRWFEDRT